MAHPLSTNFQPYIPAPGTEAFCDICMEPSAALHITEVALLIIHATDSKDQAPHLACRNCIVKTVTKEGVVQAIYNCHICRKEILLDPTDASTLGIDLPAPAAASTSHLTDVGSALTPGHVAALDMRMFPFALATVSETTGYRRSGPTDTREPREPASAPPLDQTALNALLASRDPAESWFTREFFGSRNS